MIMIDNNITLNNARIQLEALLREQEALIEDEAKLSATRKTLELFLIELDRRVVGGFTLGGKFASLRFAA